MKYSYMLNAKQQSVIYVDYKLLVEFINAEYHEDIFPQWANKI